jgi:hypothetical protein
MCSVTQDSLDGMEVGYNAARLQAKVTNDIVSINRAKWSITKIKKALGGADVCYPCFVSTHFDPQSLCTSVGKPGHERGGAMHCFDEKVRAHVQANSALFGAKNGRP